MATRRDSKHRVLRRGGSPLGQMGNISLSIMLVENRILFIAGD